MKGMQTPEPTVQQERLFEDAIRVYEKSEHTLIGKMDPSGALLVTVLHDDGTTAHARFGKHGLILGGWF